MKKSVIAPVLTALLLLGCATKAPDTEIRTVKVEVPVTVPCVVPLIEKPRMYFDELAKEDMAMFKKTQLLLAQDYVLKGYIGELEAAIKACQPTK